MSKELMNVSAQKVTLTKTFKDARLQTAATQIAAIINGALTYADERNREMAKIISKVKQDKSYVVDGFKSAAEFAEKTFNLKYSNAYALAAAGDVYNDPKASAELKAFSPYKLAEISSVKPEVVSKAIAEKKIGAGSTLQDLRAFRNEATPQKATIVKTYKIRPVQSNGLTLMKTLVEEIDGRSVESVESIDIENDVFTIEEWDEILKAYIDDNDTAKRSADVIPLPKCQRYDKPDDSKKPVLRRLYVSDVDSLVVEFYEAVKSQPVKKQPVDELYSYLKDAPEEVLAELLGRFKAEQIKVQKRAEEAPKAPSATKTPKASK